jgi:dolichyldiphosphatase
MAVTGKRWSSTVPSGPTCTDIVNQLHIADGVAVSGIAPGYGMPSAHAQFMAFLAVATGAWAFHHWHVPRALRVAFTAGMATLWAITIYSRLHLHYHSFAQVYVGSAIGAALGLAFHVACQKWVLPHLFPRVLRTQLARVLWLKDTTTVRNVLKVEHEAYEAARHLSASKKVTGTGEAGKWQP